MKILVSICTFFLLLTSDLAAQYGPTGQKRSYAFKIRKDTPNDDFIGVYAGIGVDLNTGTLSLNELLPWYVTGQYQTEKFGVTAILKRGLAKFEENQGDAEHLEVGGEFNLTSSVESGSQYIEMEKNYLGSDYGTSYNGGRTRTDYYETFGLTVSPIKVRKVVAVRGGYFSRKGGGEVETSGFSGPADFTYETNGLYAGIMRKEFYSYEVDVFENKNGSYYKTNFKHQGYSAYGFDLLFASTAKVNSPVNEPKETDFGYRAYYMASNYVNYQVEAGYYPGVEGRLYLSILIGFGYSPNERGPSTPVSSAR